MVDRLCGSLAEPFSLGLYELFCLLRYMLRDMVLILCLVLPWVMSFHANGLLDDKVLMIKFLDDKVLMIEFFRYLYFRMLGDVAFI